MRTMYSLRLLLITLLLTVFVGISYAGVYIGVSEGSKEYTEAAEAIRAELGGDVVVRPWGDIVGIIPSGNHVLIAVGSPAYAGVVEASAKGRLSKTQIIATMLPRSVYESLRKKITGPSSAVWLDQSFSRQVNLIRYAFPSVKRIGVLLGPDSKQYASVIEKAGADRGLSVNVYRVESAGAIPEVLQRLLDENDILMAVPDSMVFNSITIHNMLLATYRQKIPMVGFSPAYVRAGAIAALYATPVQVAAQTAKMVRAVLAGQAMPAAQSPSDFSVAVNASVARSMGYRLSEDGLRIQIREGEQ